MPSSTGCSSRQGAHQEAQTLTSVTLPANSLYPDRVRQTFEGRQVGLRRGRADQRRRNGGGVAPRKQLHQENAGESQEDRQRQKVSSAARRCLWFRCSAVNASPRLSERRRMPSASSSARSLLRARLSNRIHPISAASTSDRHAVGRRHIERMRTHCRSSQRRSRSVICAVSAMLVHRSLRGLLQFT